MNEKIPRQKFTSILLTRCTFHNLLLATYYSSNLKKKGKNEKHLDSRKRQNACIDVKQQMLRKNKTLLIGEQILFAIHLRYT